MLTHQYPTLDEMYPPSLIFLVQSPYVSCPGQGINSGERYCAAEGGHKGNNSWKQAAPLPCSLLRAEQEAFTWCRFWVAHVCVQHNHFRKEAIVAWQVCEGTALIRPMVKLQIRDKPPMHRPCFVNSGILYIWNYAALFAWLHSLATMFVMLKYFIYFFACIRSSFSLVYSSSFYKYLFT